MDINILIGIIPIAISIFSLAISYRTSKTQKAQIEIQVRARISSARSRFEDITLAHKDELDDKMVKRTLNSVKEEWANAYDEACQKYLDNKIDKVRFKKAYSDELKKIFEDKSFEKYYQNNKAKFTATKAVYDEWFNLEK